MIFGFALALVLAAVAWAAGLFWFVGTIPDRVADRATRTDAIVVLTGGSGRLRTGLLLLSQNRAEKLFVSGVYRGVDVKTLLALAEEVPGDLASRVGIGEATNTTGNAAETAAWMAKEGFHSLRLVTASYHMPRSLLEFRRALPDAVVIPHPVFPEHVKLKRWWAWPGTAALIVSEYDKYLAARARHLAAPLLEGVSRP